VEGQRGKVAHYCKVWKRGKKPGEIGQVGLGNCWPEEGAAKGRSTGDSTELTTSDLSRSVDFGGH